jgi:hypothetical protein
LPEVLPNLTSLTVMTDSDDTLTPFGAEKLAEPLTKMVKLEELELAQMTLPEADLTDLGHKRHSSVPNRWTSRAAPSPTVCRRC